MQRPKQDVVIIYESLPAKVGLFLLLLSSPAWLIIPAFGICAILAGVLHQVSGPAGLVTFIFIFVACLTGTFVCSDNKLILSRSGVQFPLPKILTHGFKRTRKWQEVKTAQLANFKQKGDKLSATLRLDFYRGGNAKIKLRLPKDEFEKVLLALDVWAPQCLRNDELVQVHKQLTGTSESGGSFTQLWEEELRRRFFPTSFVPLEAGTKLRDGHLVVMRQLAFGGLSALYLAHYNEKDLVVLKEAVVPQAVMAEAKAKALEMFDREAKLLAKLHHPAISKVIDNFVENDRHYIMLEHIPGQDLRQYVIENGPVPQKKVVQWAAEIADILAYLHTQDPPIIHRDLTPENLVLNQSNQVVLIDFGAANEFLGSATGTVVGKQSYISPEQFRGHPTPQTDLYALGATMYFLLTATEPEPLSRLELPPGNRFSNSIRQLVGLCTELELSDRLADAAELKSAILAAQHNQPVGTAAEAY